MILTKNSFLFKRIKTKINSFLLHETTLPPILYFLAFIYSHYPLETRTEAINIIIFAFSLVILLACNFNILFIMAPFVNQNPIVATLMFMVSLLACTEKWKVYIFILAIGDNAFAQTNSNQYFIALFSLLICIQTYRTLLFRTISENVQYFVGMASISVFYTLQILISNYNFMTGPWIVAILIIAAAGFALSLIENRIEILRKALPVHLFLDREIAHYLKMTENDAQEPASLELKIKFHCRDCRKINCFCHNEEFKNKSEYFIRQLYEDAIQRLKHSGDPLLLENYIDFLLKNKQTINALHFLGLWELNSYFNYLSHLRSKAKIEKFLNNENSSHAYQYEYIYALEYDEHSMAVAVEINQILKLKLQFWNEIIKEMPRVAKIQKFGYDIISKMHNLNIFYNKTIKIYEQKIYVFDSTVLYAMYMLSTTNFNEYAELIIKNTAKILEEVYVFQNNASETFAIRTTVNNEVKSFVNNTKYSHIQSQLKNDECFSDESTYKLIIDAVSTGLCKILHLNKNEMIDHQLKMIIPNGYKQVHSIRLNNLLNFETDKMNRIMPSKVLHKEVKFPIKGAHGMFVMGYVCIKFQVDCVKGLTFISIVKLIHDRSSHLLMDFSGNITEMQQGFNAQLLMHSEVKRYLTMLRNTWFSEQIIRQQRFNVMVNSANYIIIINSPFIELFAEKEELKQKCPPIHIEILNEETVRNRNAQADKNNKVGRQIKHMESAINNYDTESSTNSSKGGTSAVNILTVFSQNNSIPLYRFIYFIFVGIITCCIISNIGTFFVAELPWDNTLSTNNPLNDTMNLNALHMLTIKALITLDDEQIYFKQPNGLNTTRISQYFGFQNYQQSVVNFTANLEQAFKSDIYNLLGTSSDYLSQQIMNRLQTVITIANPTTNSSLPSYQNISYIDLLMIYASDLNLITQLSLYDTVMKATYSPTIADIQNCSYLSAIIDKGVNQAQGVSIAVHIALMALITILILPLFCLLRNRLSLHEKIFDLLVSIDPAEVEKEVKSLEYICNILRNFKESNDIMKMNVLDYEQNMIHPKRHEERRSSVDNDMMLGLEKYDIQKLQEIGREHEEEINSSQSFKISRVRNKTTAFGNSSTIVSSLIKNQIVKTKQQTTIIQRKRAGELDLTGSALDPNRKVLVEHWFLYLISISFVIFLTISLIMNLSYNSTYIEIKGNLLDSYNDQVLFEQYLLTIKVYLISGASAIKSIFQTSNQLNIIVPSLFAIPSYDYYDSDMFYSQSLPNCSNSTNSTASTSGPPTTGVFIQKYCQYSYTEVILRGQFGAIFKELTELRYSMDHNQSIYQTPAQTLVNIKQKIYYLESLNLRLEEIVMAKIDLLFQSIIDLAKSYKTTKLYLLIFSVIWGIICFLIGLVIVLSLKQGYFKQVFMITFLNNEMILKNKRVESFLDSIAKNTYS